MRITVRLLEAASGVQIWSERYDADLGDLFAVQEGIAQRVAEELRVELAVASHRTAVPAEAIEMYLSSRHQLRAFDTAGAAVAVKNLERSLEIAPDFSPAVAAHAIACLRSWFFSQDRQVDWAAKARASVGRALKEAADLAEAHLAAAILATQSGDYRTAARCIERALNIAPTYADAHEYLGMLQCEAGRAEDGTKRLKLAHTLDPTLVYCRTIIARQHEMRGEWDVAAAIVDDVERQHGPALASLCRAQRIRASGWRRDPDALRRLALEHPSDDTPNWRVVRLYARALCGDVSGEELATGIREVLAASQNPRFVSLTEQLATEIYAALGELDTARHHLMRAATSVLVDLEWLDRCPLLTELRKVPEWGEARKLVLARAEAVWRA
jgi:tetratricopeptide (TPR) repeat protein